MNLKETVDLEEDLKPYYVYALIDKTDDKNEVFYIGKGTGYRCEQHKHDALSELELKSEKINKIRELINNNAYDRIVISRHTTEKEAFAVEAVLIKWVYGQDNLTNEILGHGSSRIREIGNFSNDLAHLDVKRKIGLHSGDFKNQKIEQLKLSGAYEFRDNLMNEFVIRGYKTFEIGSAYKKYDPIESNGYIGFVVSILGLEFVIYNSKTLIPNIYCISQSIDSEALIVIQSLGYDFTDLINNNLYRRVKFEGKKLSFKNTVELIEFFDKLKSKDVLIKAS